MRTCAGGSQYECTAALALKLCLRLSPLLADVMWKVACTNRLGGVFEMSRVSADMTDLMVATPSCTMYFMKTCSRTLSCGGLCGYTGLDSTVLKLKRFTPTSPLLMNMLSSAMPSNTMANLAGSRPIALSSPGLPCAGDAARSSSSRLPARASSARHPRLRLLAPGRCLAVGGRQCDSDQQQPCRALRPAAPLHIY